MKSKRLLVPVLLLFALFVYQTQAQDKKGKDLVFRVVDEMPVYPGGEEALRKDIASKVKYPESAKKNGVSGKVFVTFVVNKEGKIVDPEIAREVDPALDEEALRVMSLLKTWKPGKQRGEAVNVQYTVPIKFALDSKKSTKKVGDVFFEVDEMPEYPDGDDGLRKFIAENVKYPKDAKEKGIQGKVYVSFVVNKDGSVGDAKIARGVDPSLDQESIRVVKSMKKWKPGKEKGEEVKVQYTVPINFALGSSSKIKEELKK